MSFWRDGKMFKNLKIKPQYEHTKVGLFLFNLCA